MNYEAGEYKKLPVKRYPARELRETAEDKHWRRFKAPVLVQQIGAVSSIDFSQQRPYNFVVTASTRVIVYDAATRQVKRTFARFKDKAYGGNFRHDGKLLAAGGEDGIVQIFDASSRTLLRQLKGHQRPVHVARFSRDKTHLLTAGDDATVRYWDITSGEQVARLDGHRDYVRAAAVSPINSDTWATGGYDHICKVWDVSTGQELLSLDHGSPIEDVAFYPSGAMLVTAGGREVRVWNVLRHGRLVARLTNHQKTVTCVCISPRAGPDSAVAQRLLTGSLDGHVKVYELDTFRVTHASKYPAPVLSLGLSPDCSLLAVGLSDGTLSIRKHVRQQAPEIATGADGTERRRRRRAPRSAETYGYFTRGASKRAALEDEVVVAQKRAALAPYDRLLKRFQYREALDAALATRSPPVVASLLEELAARTGLGAALGGRDAAGLVTLLEHISKYITDPRYSKLLVAIAHRVLDIYATEIGKSQDVDRRLNDLKSRLAEEAKLQDKLLRLGGMLQPILAATTFSRREEIFAAAAAENYDLVEPVSTEPEVDDPEAEGTSAEGIEVEGTEMEAYEDEYTDDYDFEGEFMEGDYVDSDAIEIEEEENVSQEDAEDAPHEDAEGS